MSRKTLFCISLVLVMVLTVGIVGACSTSTPTVPATSPAPGVTTPATTTTTAPPTTQAAATTPAAKTIELRWTSQWVPGSDDAEADMILARMINERTGGRVNAVYYGTESLGKAPDWVNMLNGGVAQMGSLMLAVYPGVFELETITDLPLVGIPDRNTLIDIMWEVYNKGYFKGLNQFKVMGFKGGAPLNQFFGSKKVQTVEDYKGLKMRGSAPPFNAYFEALGASTVAITGPEIYMAMDRKVIDGYTTAWSYVLAIKLYEVSKYCIWDPPVGIGGPTIVMSKQAWDSLPTDIQEIIDQVIIDYKTEVKNFYADKDDIGFESLKKTGMDVYTLSDAEKARFKQVADTVAQQWVAEKEAKGLPAQAAYETIQQFLATPK
ncbi:MAG: TRAP transporter substrate-binding protein DctP [Dehalococcoidales bacterium]|nr:TRAP transporter substrate-binding protein DctP [Dehalococcoidales bacterium]